MSAPRRVFYWGPPGAGRSSSIASLTGESLVVGDRDYVVRASSGIQVVVRYSSALTKFFYAPTDAVRPPEVQPVIASLAHIDGIVIVCDSQRARREHNIGWLKRLDADLTLVGRRMAEIPIVLQLNKRDLAEILTVDELASDLRTPPSGCVESIATSGNGAAAALDALVSLAGWKP
jgi:hypothetical protein